MHIFGRHPGDDDLERYYLGTIDEEHELAEIEEHLLGCPDCVSRALMVEHVVNKIRVALTDFDDPMAPEERPVLVRVARAGA